MKCNVKVFFKGQVMCFNTNLLTQGQVVLVCSVLHVVSTLETLGYCVLQ